MDEIKRGICLIFFIFSHKYFLVNLKTVRTFFNTWISFVATAVEDDDDDDEDEESDGFSDNENSEEMVDEENKDFGLKSLLEEDENKKSQVRIPDWHPSIRMCMTITFFD